MKYFAVIDTNVIVSAMLKNDSFPAQVLKEARKDVDAYLVTGNLKHFPEKSFVVTPKEMIEIINKR
ncbi:MAG: hypothetical protein IJ949_04265 [Oscillospiraceae bacterium]|nr:hypothetical protein [Oscillospiraceae bacterium]